MGALLHRGGRGTADATSTFIPSDAKLVQKLGG